MTRKEIEVRLSAVAEEAFENFRVAVELRGGVYWLIYTDGTHKRTIAALGIPEEGIRRLTRTCREVAAAK